MQHQSHLRFLQWSRAAAALFVAVFHLQAIERKYGDGHDFLGWIWFGRIGVDIFFIISGFVMVHSTRELWGQPNQFLKFLFRRAVRIYPVYWQFSLLVLALYILQPGWVNSSYAAPDTTKSLLLLPQDSVALLTVSWSLVHEVYFYLVFAVLFLIPRVRLAYFLAAWGIVTTVAILVDSPNPGMHIIGSFHSFEFILGCLAASLCRAFPGSSISRRKSGILSNVMERIGDASYSLYLSHILVFSAVGRVWYHLGVKGLIPHIGWLLLCMLAAVTFSLLNYHLVEKRIYSWGKRVTQSSVPTAIPQYCSSGT